MRESHSEFAGSIPAAYDRYLGPLLFEFSATDLAERVAGHVVSGSVLEIACGTGISTHFLRERLASEVSCPPHSTLERFRSVGFEDVQVHAVEATVERPFTGHAPRV